MTKNFALERTSRRGFLKAGVIGGAGLTVAQFVRPKELRANTLVYAGQVSQSTDDAHEDGMLGIVTTSTTSMNFIRGGYCGFRFQNVTVAQGASIIAAYLSPCFDNSLDPGGVQGIGSANVYGQAIDNAPTFTTTKHDLSHRAPTTNTVIFNSPGPGGFQSSPDISAIIQEIVNRPGWVSGNAIAILALSSISTGSTTAEIDTWDTNGIPGPNLGAELTIYEV
jgi:hypothetical protein